MRSHLLRCLIMALLLITSTFSLACSGNQQPQNTSTAARPNPSGPPLYEGFFDIADCDLIHGWAWNQNDPDAPVSVEIYDGTTLLATVKAGDRRGDLVTAGKGNGNHAFAYTPEAALKDSKPHSIHVKIAGSDYELGNSPKTITCTSE